MTTDQRFCPLCNRVFVPGEAVLRCAGCGVLHHPGCWVTNGGCATAQEHESTPVAQAYRPAGVAMGASTPHPAEGTRVAGGAQPVVSYVKPQREAAAATGEGAMDEQRDDAPTESNVPARVPGPRRPQREAPQVTPPRAPRRYEDDDGDLRPSRKAMPKVYRSHVLTDYWYVPAAVVVAAVVAVGVIFGVNHLTGGGNNAQVAASLPTATPRATPTPTTPTPVATPASNVFTTVVPTPAGPTGGTFTKGQTLVVKNTGDCLNVRTGPSTSNPAIVCLQDGDQVVVVGGPQSAGGYTWWQVNTRLGAGWAVSQYLAAGSSSSGSGG